MCFLRDLFPESAMEHYKAALPYYDIIIGIRLIQPSINDLRHFWKGFFHLPDVNQEDTYEHIRDCASVVAGKGLDHIDHAPDKQSLMDLILKRDVGLTICSWAHLRHQSHAEIGPNIRVLYDAGIKLSINSDDPAYMEDCWILHNWLLAKHLCGFRDTDIAVLAKHAIEIHWAKQSIKEDILREIDLVYEKIHNSP